MRSAGAASGAYVVNADTGKAVFRYRHTRPRILASNTKLFTTAAALARFGVGGPAGHRGARRRASSSRRRHLPRRASTWWAAATPPSAAAASRAAPTAAAGRWRRWRALLESAGIKRVTGRVYGDESALRLAPRRPGVGLPDLALRRAAQRAGLQPRPGQRERARLPVQPARVRRRPAGRRAGEAGHLRDAARPRAGKTPGGRHGAGHRAVADDGAPGDAHQQAVGQLLRRDAAQGPGRPGRRARAPPAAARALAARFARRIGGRPAAAGRRLGPLARQPRLAATAWPSCCWPCASATSSPRSSTRCRSPAATARCARGCAAAPARGRCRGKTGTLSERLGRVGLLPRPLGPDLRRSRS